DKKESDHTVATNSARCFDRARETLSRKLPVYRTHIDDEKQASRRQFGVIMAQLLRDEVAALADCLTRIGGFEDEKAVHETRIAGKRLGHLLRADRRARGRGCG